MRLLIFALLVSALPRLAVAQDADILAVARDALTDLQAPSFEQNREFCGVIGRVGDGRMAITRAQRGSVAGCTPSGYRGMAKIVATYHTHGAYGPQFDNEVPSIYDLMSVIEEEVDGFVATPGGRFWYVDWRQGEARLICGPGCLPQDPGYVDEGDVPETLGLEDLQVRMRSFWGG
ncbi:MAG: DUF4329 domain-containing protein [Pseudomonadota bacterium]